MEEKSHITFRTEFTETFKIFPDHKDQSQESCSGKDFLCPTGIECHTFSCPPGVLRCLSPEFVCDSIPHCNHGEDEQNCPPIFIGII